MSTFAVPILRILALDEHPNADSLEVATVGAFQCVVKKGLLRVGEAIAYIPEFSVLPDWLLQSEGYWDWSQNKGKLGGSEGNRVTTVRLRGLVSQGLCLPVAEDSTGVVSLRTGDEPGCFVLVREGANVASCLGVEKYEPPLPEDMQGSLYRAGQEFTTHFDIENWKRFPDILQEGEEVVFTEKLHGVCTLVVLLPYANALPLAHGSRKNILVSSKGCGSDGLAFQNTETNCDNVYIRATASLIERIDAMQATDEAGPAAPVLLFMETFGAGVQDLHYGAKEPTLRLFAAATGYRGLTKYAGWDELETKIAPAYGLELAPLVYRGPWSKEVMLEHTTGPTLLGQTHIREGIVMIPVTERYHPAIGRVSLKSVSDAYILRKGGTEYS